jgi:hypothetical protein
MSERYNNGSHYENHPRAAELHNLAPHAHLTGELHGKEDHLAPHEQTVLHAHTPTHPPTTGHGVTAFGHQDIAALAHSLWEKRGRPEGSADEDWFHAVKELRSRATSAMSD